MAPATTTMTTTVVTSTSAAVTNFDSCLVVTQAEAAKALGQPVTPGVLGNATVEGGLACVFYGPTSPKPTIPNSAQPDTVEVVVVKGPNALMWFDNYRTVSQTRMLLLPSGERVIRGLGDQAFYDGVSLNVLKGDAYLRIAVIAAVARPPFDAEKELAAVIIPHL